MSQSSPIQPSSSSRISSAVALRRPQVTTNNAIVLTLNSHGDEIDAQQNEIADLKECVASLEQDVVTLGRRDAARVDTLEATMKVVRNLEIELEALNGAVTGLLDKNKEESSSDSSGEECDITLVEKEKIMSSLTAYADPSLKELTRYAFAHKLDIAKLLPEKLPWYPENPDCATWPKITGTDDPVERFRWDETWEHDDNYRTIRNLVAYMKRHGDNLVSGAYSSMRAISEDNLERRVVNKFLSLQKGLREAGILNAKNKCVVIPMRGEVDDSDDDDRVVLPVQKSEAAERRNKAGIITSRAAGKLKVRIRKRENLPASSKYRDAKYDHAFAAKIMSDDEDQINEAGNKTGLYVSYAPLYRSKELIDLFAAVDAAVDPEASSKYINNKVRRWMVDEAWLDKEENLKYDSERRIIDSGKAWGDCDDPEELIAKREKIKLEKKALQEGNKQKARGEIKKPRKKKSKGTSKGKEKARDVEGSENESESD